MHTCNYVFIQTLMQETCSSTHARANAHRYTHSGMHTCTHWNVKFHCCCEETFSKLSSQGVVIDPATAELSNTYRVQLSSTH